MSQRIFLFFFLLIFATACEDIAPELDDNATDTDVEYSLNGVFKTNKDLTVTISGSTGYVTDFGTNNLGTNTSVFRLGDPYFKDLERVSKNRYKGKVVKAVFKFDNAKLKDILNSVKYEDTEIEVSETGINPTNSSLWDITWNRIANQNNSGGGSSGGGSGGSTGGGGTGGSTGSGTTKVTWSDWYFVQSDKALQYRFSRESGTGDGIYKIKVQYRINASDPIHCTHATCQGYIYWGGFYSKGGGSYDVQYRFYFPNKFTGNTPGQPGVYTLPNAVSYEVRSYPDGSKRIWDEAKQTPYVVYKDGSKQKIFLADNCVDNKLSNTSYHRCNDYSKGTSTTIN